MYWEKHSEDAIKAHVFEALKHNVHYADESVLGVPASYLDEKVFSKDKNFLKDAPFLSTLVENPNHIGCHTVGSSESFFQGTQEIEREVIRICANEILKGGDEAFDGYIASGGTEANIQAMWIYRNYFQRALGLQSKQIAIVCSTDSHYSMDKGANLLGLPIYKLPVDCDSREIITCKAQAIISQACEDGIEGFIVIANMMTTMFGSVDDVSVLTQLFHSKNLPFKLHVDGAYGGFYYPFSQSDSQLNFSHPDVNSVTLDAHKMAQAPYGTGIFVIRKNWMHYATTEEASYVEGEDCTLIGSRSGANAVAIWMILSKYGPHGWFEKVYILQKRSEWISEQLTQRGITHFRHPFSNIITMRATQIAPEIAAEFGLVPDNHHQPKWYKIVVMEHVTIEKVEPLLSRIDQLAQQPV